LGGMLTFLGQLARVGTTVVLVAVAVGVVWLGWQAGSTGGTQPPRVAVPPSLRSHT
jgi:hypothetical protein